MKLKNNGNRRAGFQAVFKEFSHELFFYALTQPQIAGFTGGIF